MSSFFTYKYFKRICDFIFALILIIGLIPIFLFICFLITTNSRGSIFFIQKRIGKKGKVFSCLKFRTMYPEAKYMLRDLMNSNEDIKKEFETNQKIKRDPRITNIGRILRYTSLDELPQILNVLKGDMSFIGPRPITKEEIKRYGENFEEVFSVTPGISGLWQVSGRNKLSYKSRVQLDKIYAKNISLNIDLNIFIRTIGVVLFPFDKGAY